jgi:hypothetical protein
MAYTDAVRLKYLATGVLDVELIELIRLGDEAFKATEVKQVIRAAPAGNLCGCLQIRAKETKSMNDLLQAMEYGKQAIDLLESVSLFETSRAYWADVVADAWSLRYEWTGAITDKDEELKMRKQAVEWTHEGHPEHDRYVLKLSGTKS